MIITMRPAGTIQSIVKADHCPTNRNQYTAPSRTASTISPTPTASKLLNFGKGRRIAAGCMSAGKASS